MLSYARHAFFPVLCSHALLHALSLTLIRTPCSASVLSSLSKTTGRIARSTTEAEAIEEAMSASGENKHHLWDMDMSFAESHRLGGGFELLYPNGMIECCDQVWTNR